MVVQPENAEYYRSQVSSIDLFYATKEWQVVENGVVTQVIPNNKRSSYDLSTYAAATNAQGFSANGTGYPIVDYDAVLSVRTPACRRLHFENG